MLKDTTIMDKTLFAESEIRQLINEMVDLVDICEGAHINIDTGNVDQTEVTSHGRDTTFTRTMLSQHRQECSPKPTYIAGNETNDAFVPSANSEHNITKNKLNNKRQFEPEKDEAHSQKLQKVQCNLQTVLKSPVKTDERKLFDDTKLALRRSEDQPLDLTFKNKALNLSLKQCVDRVQIQGSSSEENDGIVPQHNMSTTLGNSRMKTIPVVPILPHTIVPTKPSELNEPKFDESTPKFKESLRSLELKSPIAVPTEMLHTSSLAKVPHFKMIYNSSSKHTDTKDEKHFTARELMLLRHQKRMSRSCSCLDHDEGLGHEEEHQYSSPVVQGHVTSPVASQGHGRYSNRPISLTLPLHRQHSYTHDCVTYDGKIVAQEKIDPFVQLRETFSADKKAHVYPGLLRTSPSSNRTPIFENQIPFCHQEQPMLEPQRDVKPNNSAHMLHSRQEMKNVAPGRRLAYHGSVQSAMLGTAATLQRSELLQQNVPTEISDCLNARTMNNEQFSEVPPLHLLASGQGVLSQPGNQRDVHQEKSKLKQKSISPRQRPIAKAHLQSVPHTLPTFQNVESCIPTSEKCGVAKSGQMHNGFPIGLSHHPKPQTMAQFLPKRNNELSMQLAKQRTRIDNHYLMPYQMQHHIQNQLLNLHPNSAYSKTNYTMQMPSVQQLQQRKVQEGILTHEMEMHNYSAIKPTPLPQIKEAVPVSPSVQERQIVSEVHRQTSKSGHIIYIQCDTCDKRAIFLCSQCKKVAYCSRTCQSSGWASHKPLCVNG